MKHVRIALLLVLVLLAFVVFLPIDVAYSIDTVGRVYPVQEWTLEQESDGSVVSTVYNYRNGRNESFQKFQFERGDIIGIQWRPGLTQSGSVRLSDSVASIQSFLLEQELLRQENELALARASLRTLQVGRKAPVIQEASQQLELAQERLQLAELNYNRNKALFEAGVIARASFDVFNNEYQLARISVQAAESRLLDVRTGERPEDINVVRSQVRASEREIALLKAKQQRYAITAPLSGQIRFGAEKSSLLVVTDTSAFVLSFPVEEREVRWLPANAQVQVRPPGQLPFYASLTSYSETVSMLAGKQVRLGHAACKPDSLGLSAGMIIPCTVICDTISLWQYTRRKFSFSLK